MKGRVVSERYKIEKYLGGGMSSVYLARDIILDREVVVKLIKVDQHNRDKSKARFQREVESTIQLSHPNIVNVLDVDESEEYHLLVTEVVHGPTLKEYIQENHPVPIDEAVRLAEMILRGINHAHRAGIIHRDIKPQNILLDSAGNLKITDFGIAKALSETRMTETNQVMGSVQYISPEQGKGQKTDERTDIYSFGIVLFELLTGELPFEGETPVSVALKHISEPIPDMWQHRELPQGLVNITLKCTEKNMYHRYRHTDDVLRDFSEYQNHHEPYFQSARDDDEKTMILPVPAYHEPAENNEENTDKEAEETDDEKPKRKGSFLLWLIPLLLLLGAGGVLAQSGLFGDQTVMLPEFKEMTMAEAEDVLAENELAQGEVTEEYNEDFEEEQIIETSPASGMEVDKGTEIDFTVSLGEEPYTMEDFTGDSYGSVRSTIDNIGFNAVNIEEQYDNNSDEGEILSQSIDPSSEIHPAEETLDLVVSQGMEPIEMTDFVGQSYESAKSELESQGFNVEITNELYSDEVPEGSIISQSPNYGEFLPGSTIQMVVSLGQQEGETQYVQDITIPYSNEESTEEPSGGGGSEDENSESESSEEGPEDESPEEGATGETEGEPDSQTVEIFIEDKDNDISDVYETFEMTEEREYTINLTIAEGETASYRVDIDGETEIDEDVEY